MKEKTIEVKGFGRFTLVNAKTGKIDHDSGWIQNTITESGFDDAIVGAVGAIAASSQLTHLQLATQTDAVVSTQVALSGEFGARKAVTPALEGAGTLLCTANWTTAEGTESSIQAIGAYGSSSGSSVLNGILTALGAKTTDQELNASLRWQFS